MLTALDRIPADEAEKMLASHVRARKREIIENAFATRVGYHADAEAWEKFARDFGGGSQEAEAASVEERFIQTVMRAIPMGPHGTMGNPNG